MIVAAMRAERRELTFGLNPEGEASMDDEVYYCGNCDRQQQPSEGIPCKICKKRTVSWYTNREGVERARSKWRSLNG